MLARLPLTAAALIAAALNPDVERLSHDILKQLVEINTTDSVGSTTTAAQAMAQRHGNDERLLVSSFDEGVDFYYRYLKALTSVQ